MKWSEIFRMGGYGFYVWGSYLVAFVLMAGEVILIFKRRKTLREQTNRD
jgi:heme exporter protein D